MSNLKKNIGEPNIQIYFSAKKIFILYVVIAIEQFAQHQEDGAVTTTTDSNTGKSDEPITVQDWYKKWNKEIKSDSSCYRKDERTISVLGLGRNKEKSKIADAIYLLIKILDLTVTENYLERC